MIGLRKKLLFILSRITIITEERRRGQDHATLMLRHLQKATSDNENGDAV